MLIETEIRDSQVLDWLCRQQDLLAVDIEFSHRASEKEYSALPLHIQSFTKTAKVKNIEAPSDRKSEVDHVSLDDSDIPMKKAAQVAISLESRSATSSSSRAGEWYPKDIAANGVKNGKTNQMNQPITFLEDSNDLLLNNDINGMWNQFTDQGFLYFRDFLDKEDIMKARTLVLDSLRSMGHIDEEDKILASNGWTIDCMTGAMIGGKNKYSDGTSDQRWKKLCQTKTINSVFSNDRISRVLQMLQTGMERSLKIPCVAREFGRNFGFLRVKGHKEYTAEHADVFYFRVSSNSIDNIQYFEFHRMRRRCSTLNSVVVTLVQTRMVGTVNFVARRLQTNQLLCIDARSVRVTTTCSAYARSRRILLLLPKLLLLLTTQHLKRGLYGTVPTVYLSISWVHVGSLWGT